LAVLQERWLPREKTPPAPVVPQPNAAVVHYWDFQLHAKRPWEYKLPNLFDWHACIAQHTRTGAFQNNQSLFGFLMLMD
jgi:hypothetical protein